MVSDRVVPGGPARMGSPRVARWPHLGLRSVATRPYAGISPVRGNHGCDRTNRWVCVSGDGLGAARDEGRGFGAAATSVRAWCPRDLRDDRRRLRPVLRPGITGTAWCVL